MWSSGAWGECWIAELITGYSCFSKCFLNVSFGLSLFTVLLCFLTASSGYANVKANFLCSNHYSYYIHNVDVTWKVTGSLVIELMSSWESSLSCLHWLGRSRISISLSSTVPVPASHAAAATIPVWLYFASFDTKQAQQWHNSPHEHRPFEKGCFYMKIRIKDSSGTVCVSSGGLLLTWIGE